MTGPVRAPMHDERATPDVEPAPVRVPITDRRIDVAMTWIVRGPWAELLGPGAEIITKHRDDA